MFVSADQPRGDFMRRDPAKAESQSLTEERGKCYTESQIHTH